MLLEPKLHTERTGTRRPSDVAGIACKVDQPDRELAIEQALYGRDREGRADGTGFEGPWIAIIVTSRSSVCISPPLIRSCSMCRSSWLPHRTTSCSLSNAILRSARRSTAWRQEGSSASGWQPLPAFNACRRTTILIWIHFGPCGTGRRFRLRKKVVLKQPPR